MGLLLRCGGQGQLHLHGAGGRSCRGRKSRRRQDRGRRGAGARARAGARQPDFLPLLFRAAVLLHGGGCAAACCGTGQRRSRSDERSRFPRLLRHSRRPLHRHRAVGGQSAGSAQHRHQARRNAARFAADPARGSAAHLRLHLQLARGHRAGAALRRHPRLRHLRLGKGLRPVGRGKARDRHPQGDRLGNRRRDQDEVLGRRADFADRLPARLRRRLPACVPLFRRAVRAGAERLGGALSALRADAGDRRLSGRDAVLLHRLSLHGGDHGADLARGDHRSRRGDARCDA